MAIMTAMSFNHKFNLPKPVLIFDFDGTIADTFTPTMKLLEKDFKLWGDEFDRHKTIRQLRGLTIQEIIKSVPGGWWKFVYLLIKAKKQVKSMITQIEPYPGMVYTLRSLHDLGMAMIIVTSNDQEAVVNFLKKHNLGEVFLTIVPTKGIFNKDKVLKKVLKRYRLQPQEAFYIGDEIRDVQACHKIGLPIIAATYGFNSQEGIERFQPDLMIKKPTQLLTLIDKMQVAK